MTTPPLRLATLLLASFAGGGLVSCTSDTASDGNIFLSDRAPRYGHGGTDNPRYKYGATDTGAADPRGETRYLNGRKPRESTTGEARESTSPDSTASTDDRGDTPAPEGNDTEAPPRRIDPEPEPEPAAPEPAPKPAVTEDIPYATPVPGQDGKVYSPFHNGGYVDVSGMPSGSKARCPYTKKIFRVP